MKFWVFRFEQICVIINFKGILIDPKLVIFKDQPTKLDIDIPSYNKRNKKKIIYKNKKINKRRVVLYMDKIRRRRNVETKRPYNPLNKVRISPLFHFIMFLNLIFGGRDDFFFFFNLLFLL